MKRLTPPELRRRCVMEGLRFETTSDLPDLDEPPGQDRALEALRFGVGIKGYGYNIFALGPPGLGKHQAARAILDPVAAAEPAPGDWCYVHNFADPQRPKALGFPAGRGRQFRTDLERLLEELRVSIPATFEGEEYRRRKKALEDRFSAESEQPFVELEKEAQERGVAVIRTPVGVALAPSRKGTVMEPDEFRRLPDEEQERFRAEMNRLQARLQESLATLPAAARKHREALRELNRDMAVVAAGQLLDEVRGAYADLPAVCEYLDTFRQDVREHVEEFLGGEATPLEGLAAALGRRPSGERAFRRYAVNLLVDRGGTRGAPVVFEDHPTCANLIGRMEHLAEFGNLVTDFLLLRAGALHRANGGYLILDARKLLQQPFSWEELKRALRSRRARIESPAQLYGLTVGASLEPEPIPLDVKVVLVGDRLLYYLLAELDPEFLELFKVAADFDETLQRDGEGEVRFTRLVAQLQRREGLRPFDRAAVARLVENAGRSAGDARKLSTHLEELRDLLKEADHRAAGEGRDRVGGADVESAIAAGVRRADRVRQHLLEEVARGTLLVETTGARVGQINGLSVMRLGRFCFGRPQRITARVRMGGGKVVDIEREVALGGPLHSKGVLILSGFLGARYAPESPLSLSASLVFEQSYSGVEGDSASSAELLALLSALADVPLRQSLAVTGSVNQQGEVQAVGGVTEKVEGFFDVCAARGLTGAEGVVIPESNVEHLMLREDVVAAVEAGRFQVLAVRTVDEALELLTGRPAGERDESGRFPPDTVNHEVEARLTAFAEKARSFAAGAKTGDAA